MPDDQEMKKCMFHDWNDDILSWKFCDPVFIRLELIFAKVVNSTAKEATKETSKEASKEPQTPRKRTHGEAPMAELVDVQIKALLVCFW